MALLTAWRRATAAACAAALAVAAASAAQAPEEEVRAAFLYNFTKFVEWPPPSGPGGERFRMCIFADEHFTHVVDAIVKGESVGARPLVVETPEEPEQARACHVLFLSRGEDEAERMLTAVKDLPVLTVGDSPHFLQQGGAIQFVLENRRVRFDISLPAVERAGLRVSSNLLRVARTIRQDGAGQ
jgi:hypothetical protein